MKRTVLTGIAFFLISTLVQAQDSGEIVGNYYLLAGDVIKNEDETYQFYPKTIYMDNWIKIRSHGEEMYSIQFMDFPEAYIMHRYKDNVFYFYHGHGNDDQRYIWIDGSYLYLSVFPNLYDSGIYDENFRERLKDNSYLKIDEFD